MSDKTVHIVGGVGGKWVRIADGYTNFDNVTDFGWNNGRFYVGAIAWDSPWTIPDPDKVIYRDVCNQLGLDPEASED